MQECIQQISNDKAKIGKEKMYNHKKIAIFKSNKISSACSRISKIRKYRSFIMHFSNAIAETIIWEWLIFPPIKCRKSGENEGNTSICSNVFFEEKEKNRETKVKLVKSHFGNGRSPRSCSKLRKANSETKGKTNFRRTTLWSIVNYLHPMWPSAPKLGITLQ